MKKKESRSAPSVPYLQNMKGFLELSWKRRLILLGVVFYFAISFFSSIPGYYSIRSIHFLDSIVGAYQYLGFRQDWDMFSPPPRINETIQLAHITPRGWGPLTEPYEKERVRYQSANFFLPRGLGRLLTFTRSSEYDRSLDKDRNRKFFFQQWSDYYCYGKGKVSNLLVIRFYLTTQAMPYFYPKDRLGDPLPPESNYNGTIPMYERNCSDI